MSSDYSNTISGKMAAFAVAQRYEQLPHDVRRLAHLVLLDTLGCALAGSGTDEVAQIRRAMRDTGGSGDCAMWGSTETAPLPLAALANGAAVHAREIDDFGGCAHSGSVVIPAALTTAARLKANGAQLLTAIVVGYDVANRAMEGGGGYLAFKERGWHSTATCGVFGAAAAVGYLLGLNANQMQWALGYAGSNAGGTWAFIPDGAMSKRVHPGLAAQTGVVAAYLAANNVTGPTSIFEAEWGGFFPTYVPGKLNVENAVGKLGEDYRIRRVGFKPYAACQGTHSSLDVVLGLRKQHGLSVADVAKVTVRGSATHVKQLSKQNVQTMLDAQMSLPYSIAAALTSGGAMLDQYTRDALRRSDVLELASRVTVTREQSVENGQEPYVDVVLNDGRVLSGRERVAHGDCTNPLSEEELRDKFRITAGTLLDQQQVARLEGTVERAHELGDAGELVAILCPSGAQTQRRAATV